MNKLPLSVVIITKNEERNMHDCLKSVVDWANEIVVVDDQSTDKTVAIAKSYGAQVHHREPAFTPLTNSAKEKHRFLSTTTSIRCRF